MHSNTETVDEYLATLLPESREAVAAVRNLVNRHLPRGYVEVMKMKWRELR